MTERAFAWSNMFVRPEDDPREQGERPQGERGTLVRYLRDYRLTLELKCAGLDAEDMARRSVPPSNLSLLGLVRHLTETEQYWFRAVLAGQAAAAPPYSSEDDPDGDFNGAEADPEVVAGAWATWRAEVAFAETLVAAAPDLDISGDTGRGDGEPDLITLREVLIHMIEEYARHAGHADLLRERIDGRIGQ